jgi:hypothetical protein
LELIALLVSLPGFVHAGGTPVGVAQMQPATGVSTEALTEAFSRERWQGHAGVSSTTLTAFVSVFRFFRFLDRSLTQD